MKYLHVCPPWYVFHGENNLRQPNVPLGAAYCARAAMQVGWRAVIWNGDLLPEGGENQYSEEMTSYSGYLVNQSRPDNPVWQELRRVLQDVRPDVIGITALTASFPSALRVAAVVKEECPDCKTVIGGPHPNALPTEVAQMPNLDAVVFGEGEQTLMELLDAWRVGTPIVGMAGVATQSQGQVIKGPDREFVENLDELGWPTKGVVYDNHGLLTRDNFGLVMWSRGCPYDCDFCASPSLWTRRMRWRTPRDMAAEMLAIHKEYDTRYFSFEDDTFSVNRARTMELVDEIIKTGLPTVPGFRWTCNTRPDRVDEELLVHMKEAGCAAVAIGIESGNPRMLKKMIKAFTVEQVREAIHLIKKVGMISSGQFLIGMPTETEEEMWDTVKLADELECESVMLSVATPLPATALYAEASALGLIPEEGIDWATVTTKNDGMLMTVDRGGQPVHMPKAERDRVIADIHAAFDKIQHKTLDAKNNSRRWYEAQYLPEDETVPVYGIRKTVPDFSSNTHGEPSRQSRRELPVLQG
jgi:radical SAM superfamily enzyme YgiQ (UPF0313 family)